MTSTQQYPIARRAAFRIGVVTLLITSTLVAIGLVRYGALDFARMGERFCCGVEGGSTGYDGQFNLYIAAFGANATPLIDGATLRYQRILYPAAARALSFGSPPVAPYSLIAINLAAHTASAALLAFLIARVGKRSALPFTALALTLWFGALIAVRLDLAEPLMLALALSALVTYLERRDRLTALLLILSTLTKEIGLVFAAGIAIHAFFNRERARAVYLFFAPAAAFLVWWGVMYITFGTLPTRYPAAQNLLPIPFNGLFREESPVEFFLLAIWLGIPTLLLFLAAVVRIVRTRQITLPCGLMLSAAAWVMLMPDVSWQDPVAAYRVAIPLIPCGLLFLAEAYPRLIWWAAGLWIASFPLLLITPGMW